MNSNEKIILCSRCGSKGYIEGRELEDYHKNEYRHYVSRCTPCQGSGRLIETTLVTYRPYDVLKEYPALKEELDSSKEISI